MKKLRRLLARLRRHPQPSPQRDRIRKAINRVRRAQSPRPLVKPLAMFDAISVDQIPKDAQAVAGYTSGNWPTFPEVQRKFPRAHKLSIAISASHDADCLDIERGDASPSDAPGWVKRQMPRVKRPVVYASRSDMPAVLRSLASGGLGRSRVRVWSAHYTYKPHICGPHTCGASFQADATQWTDKARGRNLDESLCTPNFFS